MDVFGDIPELSPNLFSLRKSINDNSVELLLDGEELLELGLGMDILCPWESLLFLSKVKQSILSVPEASVLAASLNLTVDFESCVYDLLSFCITLDKVCSSCNLIRVVNKRERRQQHVKDQVYEHISMKMNVITPDVTNEVVTSMTRSPLQHSTNSLSLCLV
jgi:hypothetical protein